eukprot:1850798-Rhodomonas_salina.1
MEAFVDGYPPTRPLPDVRYSHTVWIDKPRPAPYALSAFVDAHPPTRLLRAPYALSGTHIRYGDKQKLPTPYALSGTHIRYGVLTPYALPGTNTQHAATRPILTLAPYMSKSFDDVLRGNKDKEVLYGTDNGLVQTAYLPTPVPWYAAVCTDVEYGATRLARCSLLAK